MTAILIWVHNNQAKLFHLKPQSIHVESVHYKGPRHADAHLDSENFFRQLVDLLLQKEPAKWLLMGPGLAQKHFFRHLESHHPKLTEQVIGVERVDQMPDSEILSVGRKFLNDYYLYQGVAN